MKNREKNAKEWIKKIKWIDLNQFWLIYWKQIEKNSIIRALNATNSLNQYKFFMLDKRHELFFVSLFYNNYI